MSATMLARAVRRQQRLWADMQDISKRADEEGRDLTAEERATWDVIERDLNEAGADVERFQRAVDLDKIDRDDIIPTGGDDRSGGASDAEKRYAEAFQVYMRRGMGRLNSEQRELLESMHIDLRAQSTQIDSAGGYLVPEGFRNKLVEVMKAYGGLMGLAEVITTDSGQDLPWVSNDDTGNEGEILGENQAVGNQDVSFGGRKLKAHIFSSKMVKLPVPLLQDSAFDLETWLPGKLGERIGRRSARAWVTGTGVDQPEGILTNVTTGKTGANGQTTSLIYDDLIDLEHSVDVAYRNERCRFVLNDLTLAVIRKMKDGQSRPLWVPTPTPGMSSTINGRPYTIDNAMPVPAASAKSILFGDFKAAYVIRIVRGISTVRLSERYAELLQVAYFAWARMDGAVQDPNAVKAYAHSAS